MFLAQGFELVEGFLSRQQIEDFNSTTTDLNFPANSGGIRNVEKKLDFVASLAKSDKTLSLVQQYLTGKPSLVRAILFNKTPENNWLVTWHQDKTVAVSERFELEGWGPWTEKDQTHHVQPPTEVLERMVTFRIHLDDTDTNNGCLKVIPGSHQEGILAHSAIRGYIEGKEVISCEANAGSLLAMRPHLLHASSKAIEVTQRRVLHLEYSDYQLPEGIFWA